MFSLRRRFSSMECLAPKAGSGTILWQRHAPEAVVGPAPGPPRKTPSPETSHTAPVTPLHESYRGRSPLRVPPPARAKASSTPQLLDEQRSETSERPAEVPAVEKETEMHEGPAVVGNVRIDRETVGTESVLQKFRKSLSLRFQAAAAGKKGSKESFGPESENPPTGGNSEEEPANYVEEVVPQQQQQHQAQPSTTEQKHKFGSLIWRPSKEKKKKKLSKSIRSAKCNSGDSGIQIEMAAGRGGFGDSSESHDTDALGDELDSPPLVRRRRRGEGRGDDEPGAEPEVGGRQAAGPLPQPIGPVLVDELEADLRCRPRPDAPAPDYCSQSVRRTSSDLGARRTAPRPRRRPADAAAVATLRRSLSQPVDIDKVFVDGACARRIAAAPPPPPPALTSSEDEARTTSNSESSLASLPSDRPPGGGGGAAPPLLAEAVFDHVAIDGEELAFRAGDVVRVLDAAHDEWWWGSAGRRSAPGWFPSCSVRVRPYDAAAHHAAPRDAASRRAGVVAELVQTERDFVACLGDVVVGAYLEGCRSRPDMFDEGVVRDVFGNVEELLAFQRRFLADLEARVDAEAPHASRVGACFLRHREGFAVYSEYCNGYPASTAALQELYRREGYREFFESCRLRRDPTQMIPLDGHLLTPVQRICKYPLQLAELLKYTGRDHPDHSDVAHALDAMRGVAVLVNERKRRMECLEKLARWQLGVDGWEGEDLIESSSRLIHHGEVVRVTTGMWTSNITLFLFDHQIVYCKKDMLKRNSFAYKGRIPLDDCEVVDLPDGKDLLLGVSIRHSIRLLDRRSDRSLLFCCRSAKDKQRWLRAFDEEREAASEGPELDLPPAARRLARLAARRDRGPPPDHKDRKPPRADYSTDSLGRRVGRVGNWFGFKRSRHHQRRRAGGDEQDAS